MKNCKQTKKEWGAIILKPSCANRCLFCGQVPKASAEELKKQELAIAKNLVEFRRTGVKKIEISGNDPVEYKKLALLVKYIKQLGFSDIQLSTHGRDLADEAFLDSLIAAGINRFRIPLYGATSKIHDSITQSAGSFAETHQGLKYLIKKPDFVEIQVSFLIMRQNKDNVCEFLDLMKKLKIDDFYIAYPFLAKDDDFHYIPLKDLGPYANKAFIYAKKIKQPVKFFEIPYCVFGFYSQNIINNTLPPDLGKNCQPEGAHKTGIKDMPAYRMKKHMPICQECVCRDFCDGFPINDVEKYGTGKLKAVKKINYEK